MFGTMRDSEMKKKETAIFLRRALVNEGGGGGFFQEFFPARAAMEEGWEENPCANAIYDAPRYDDTTLATQPFGANLPMDNIPRDRMSIQTISRIPLKV